MEQTTNVQSQKRVRIIPATVQEQGKQQSSSRPMRVAAYCRVSTKEEEQLNSYEVQRRYYTEKITSEPNWKLVDIYADKGISGTSTKKRDEFNRMIAACKRGRIDMIITKSISRFSRNTVDCLQYVRMLKELSVDVYFEEQGIHSTQSGAEFYITIYGSIAQSESENISANVRWGIAQSAKAGNVSFQYKRFLGYRKGADGKPEIVPEQAEIVKRIYKCYLSGDSAHKIASDLTADGIPTCTGSRVWQHGTVTSILKNEKYKGDAVLNKTYVVDCISKKVKINNGERPKYYVENSHPAIIDAETYARVQAEMARRSSMKKVKQVGTTTQMGKYSGKYALTELLVCGECGTPYRRCTWRSKNGKRIVWRCIKRLDYGKRVCRNSPTLDEYVLHSAIMNAIQQIAMRNTGVLDVLKSNISAELGEAQKDRRVDICVRIAEIESEFNEFLNRVSAHTSIDTADEERIATLMKEKHQLDIQLNSCLEAQDQQMFDNSRITDIFTIVDGLRNHPLMYDDKLVRQLLERVIVDSKERIRVVFMGEAEIEQRLDC